MNLLILGGRIHKSIDCLSLRGFIQHSLPSVRVPKFSLRRFCEFFAKLIPRHFVIMCVVLDFNCFLLSFQLSTFTILFVLFYKLARYIFFIIASVITMH